jgi:hypothetical protein
LVGKGEGRLGLIYRQQQEDRLRATTEAATMVVRRRNISKMLESTAGLAIKKTPGI